MYCAYFHAVATTNCINHFYDNHGHGFLYNNFNFNPIDKVLEVALAARSARQELLCERKAKLVKLTQPGVAEKAGGYVSFIIRPLRIKVQHPVPEFSHTVSAHRLHGDNNARVNPWHIPA
jgi:hypothetical protein